MSTRTRLIGLLVASVSLPLSAAEHKAVRQDAAPQKSGHVIATKPVARQSAAKPAPARVAARPKRTKLVVRKARSAASGATAALNRSQLQLTRAMATNADASRSYREQLAAYQSTRSKAATDYQDQLRAWEAGVFAATPPGYHVELASTPPGYHLEPISPGYHLERVTP